MDAVRNGNTNREDLRRSRLRPGHRLPGASPYCTAAPHESPWRTPGFELKHPSLIREPDVGQRLGMTNSQQSRQPGKLPDRSRNKCTLSCRYLLKSSFFLRWEILTPVRTILRCSSRAILSSLTLDSDGLSRANGFAELAS
jgi:hypothetical protein